ncbi:UNVERIFIED_CONTAM: hypothetical protein HDU68_010399 [Siphonaria sp. JEL0065]|nr:hypothetical protein HDU68_010399 [Siphonaria sp. JEL0065]
MFKSIVAIALGALAVSAQNRCGTTWEQANSVCGVPCVYPDAPCPTSPSQFCFADLDQQVCSGVTSPVVATSAAATGSVTGVGSNTAIVSTLVPTVSGTSGSASVSASAAPNSSPTSAVIAPVVVDEARIPWSNAVFIIGLIAVLLAFSFFICCLLFCCHRKKRDEKKEEDAEAQPAAANPSYGAQGAAAGAAGAAAVAGSTRKHFKIERIVDDKDSDVSTAAVAGSNAPEVVEIHRDTKLSSPAYA